MKRLPRHQRESEGGRTLFLPEASFQRLDALRERNGRESVEVVIDEAAELLERLRNAREIEAYAKLTPRLQEVLRMIAEGMSTKEIAGHLEVSKKTVELHRSRLMTKLEIHNVALLARYAVRVGAVPP
jgi:DNA-binding NarL/FixJ family response regulator